MLRMERDPRSAALRWRALDNAQGPTPSLGQLEIGEIRTWGSSGDVSEGDGLAQAYLAAALQRRLARFLQLLV